MKTRNKTARKPAVLDEEPLIKADDDSEEMEGDDEGEDDDGEDDDEGEDDGDMGKSMPSMSDLSKSLDALEGIASIASNGGSLRKSELARKVATGEDLSKSEKAEMRRLLDDESDEDAEPFEKSHREEWRQDPAIDSAFEASTFLDAQSSAICKSLDAIRDVTVRGNAETNTLVGRLAEGVVATGRIAQAALRKVAQLEQLVKSMGDEADLQPAAPKARTSRVGQPYAGNDMQKSMNPQARAAQGKQLLSKDEIAATLTDLVKSTEPAVAAGTGKYGIVDGIDFTREETLFETTKQVTPAAMRVVLKKRGIDPASVGL